MNWEECVTKINFMTTLLLQTTSLFEIQVKYSTNCSSEAISNEDNREHKYRWDGYCNLAFQIADSNLGTTARNNWNDDDMENVKRFLMFICVFSHPISDIVFGVSVDARGNKPENQEPE